MRARLKKAAALLLCGCMLSALLPGAQAEAGASDDAPAIPGYTQYTASTLDTARDYLVVTRDSDGNVYALYASENGAGVSPGALTGANGACTAVLNLDGAEPSAVYLKDNSKLEMSALHFRAEETEGGIALFSNNYYLALGNSMFTDNAAELMLTVLNGSYTLSSPASLRILNFNRVNDSASLYPNHITDFWGPRGDYKFPIYLYVRGEWTAPEPEPPEYAEGAPAGGVTVGQPFARGTGGSDNFRIPALITLSDGTLLAAVDARWDHAGDACALDTIVSYSTDNGETWNYSFANFFNDSTNAKNLNATAFIDPVMIAGNDDTVYLLVDLFPGGIGLNTAPAAPAASTGYTEIDGVQRLMLYTRTSGQTDSGYDYYVGDFVDGFAPVYAADSSTGAAYYVDAHYYLYNAEKEELYCRQLGSDKLVHQNVFFYNADLHVRGATYLWLVKTEDGGKTWSDPTILNPQIRKTTGTHQFYGVGPGAGLCLEDGTIVLPCYTFTGGTANSSQIASFIYSSDGGETWHRSDDATSGGHWSSESALVQIDAATLRHFYRDGYATLYYTDHTWSAEEEKWVAGSPVNTGAIKTSNNQLSAIKYSKTIDGKTAILVSTAATGTGTRSNGKIYTFTLNEDNTMDLAYTYSVTEGSYSYSSLTELKDGSIGLLYEGNGVEYHRFAIEDIADGSIIDGRRTVTVPLYGTRTERVAAPGPSAEELAAVDPNVVAVSTKTMEDTTIITYTGLKEGETNFTSGGIVCAIRVEPENMVSVELAVGETKSFPVESDRISREADPLIAAAEIETDDQSFTVTGAQGNLGTDASYNGTEISLSKALYLFTGNNTDGFTISAKTADGTVVYLKPSNGDAGYPSSTTAATVKCSVGSAENSFYLLDNGNKYLHFYRDGKNVFDRVGTTAGFQAACSFLLYRPASAGEESSAEIPGYVQAANLEDIVDGGYYLIVAKYNDTYFALYPSNSTSSKYSHVVKINAQSEQTTETVSVVSHSLVVTGVAGGTTDVVVDGNIYRLAVTDNSVIITGGSSTTHQTVKNPDGSTTTTVTNKRTGAVTATTKYPDGTVAVVETKKDGSMSASEKRPDGTHGATTVSAGGVFKAEATLSQKAVEAAAEAGGAIPLPIMTVQAGTGAGTAPEIKVSLPKADSAVTVEVPVENATPGTVLLLVKEDGGEALLKTTALTENGVAVALEGSATLKVADNTKSFADTAAVQGWAGDAIAFVTARELFGGVGGDRFAPVENMNRAMLVTVLARLDGQDTDGGETWYAKSVAWSVEQGISDGTNMEDAVSREQLVTILYRYAGSPALAEAELNGYTDADQVSGWARSAMQWAVEQGILTGKSGNLLDPAATATRAEVSAILMRFINQI